MSERQSWEDLPDVEPTKKASWEDLPDIDEQPLSSEQVQAHIDAGGARFKEDALKHALSFISGGGPLVDEMSGAAAAWQDAPRALMQSGGSPSRFSQAVLDRYRSKRDDVRKTVGDAQAAGPTVKGVPVLPVAGAVASTLGVGAPESMLGRLAAGAAQGGLYGLTDSRADLTKGDVGGMLRDTGAAAGLGLAGAGAGEAVTALPRLGANVLQRAGVSARLGRAAKDVADVQSDVAAARGRLGSLTQEASRTNENLLREVAGPPSTTAGGDLAQEALVALQSPERRAVSQSVIENNLERLPQQNAAIAKAKADYQALMTGADQEAAKRTADYFSGPIFDNEVAPRLWRFAQRAGAGYLLGKASETLTGDKNAGFYGGALGASVGAQGTMQMLRNVAKSPRVRAAAGDFAAQTVVPSLDAFGRALGAGAASKPGAKGLDVQQDSSGTAWAEFQRRFGFEPKDDEEVADRHFIESQRGSPLVK